MFRIGSQPQVQHAAQVSTATSPQGGSKTSTQLDALMKALDQAIQQLSRQYGSSPRATGGGDRVELPSRPSMPTRPARPGTSTSQDGAHVIGRPTSPTHQPSRPAPDGPRWFPTRFPDGLPDGFPKLPGKTPSLPDGSHGHGRPDWAGAMGATCGESKSIAGGTIGTYTEK